MPSVPNIWDQNRVELGPNYIQSIRVRSLVMLQVSNLCVNTRMYLSRLIISSDHNRTHHGFRSNGKWELWSSEKMVSCCPFKPPLFINWCYIMPLLCLSLFQFVQVIFWITLKYPLVIFWPGLTVPGSLLKRCLSLWNFWKKFNTVHNKISVFCRGRESTQTKQNMQAAH